MKNKRIIYILIAIAVIVVATVMGALCGRLLIDSII